MRKNWLPKIVIVIKDNRWNWNFKGKAIDVVTLAFKHLSNEKMHMDNILIEHRSAVIAESELQDP